MFGIDNPIPQPPFPGRERGLFLRIQKQHRHRVAVLFLNSLIILPYPLERGRGRGWGLLAFTQGPVNARPWADASTGSARAHASLAAWRAGADTGADPYRAST